MRCLDIGPKDIRLDGFETLDIKPLLGIDYVLDASGPLPFEDNSFDLIHASHILEHISYLQTKSTLSEWTRILKPTCWLEIWVPDTLAICRQFIGDELSYEGKGTDPCIQFCRWVYPGFAHRAAFTKRYLMELFKRASLREIEQMPNSETRHPKPANYQWRDLGIKGMK